MSTAHAERALQALRGANVDVVTFSDFGENPDTDMVERGRVVAERASIDSLVGFGGGSSLDCAKGINFVLTNGGRMADYWGFGKARKPLLPMIRSNTGGMNRGSTMCRNDHSKKLFSGHTPEEELVLLASLALNVTPAFSGLPPRGFFGGVPPTRTRGTVETNSVHQSNIPGIR